MKRFELLAPAGSYEILKAVEAAGADAVYLGGTAFGARAYANNFTEAELIDAISYMHIRGKRLYLTVNTLMKNQEIENELYDFLAPLYENGLDGVIVQDLGAVYFIHESFPDMEIHTSTQMTITGVEGVQYLKKFGVTRVVMARELSLSEMKKIHQETGMELEAFVHGALCYCYSGQCLFSSMLGGRSGNRGRCAQPCRQMYSVLDQKRNVLKKDSYILSLKDMCGIEDLPNLMEAGVFSLKIEGRMKQAEYAAGTVSLYRKYIDILYQNRRYEVSKEDRNLIADLGNRCGFTNAYYYKQNESSMVTYIKPNYERKDTDILSGVEIQKVKVSGEVTLRLGEPSRFTVYDDKYCITVTGNEPLKASNRPLLKKDVEERLKKTGDTFYEFDELGVDMEDGIFIPNGQLNQLRRDALEAFQQEQMGGYKRVLKAKKSLPRLEKQVAKLVSCLVSTKEQLDCVLNSKSVELIYLDFSLYNRKNFINEMGNDVLSVRAHKKKVGFAFPYIFREKEAAFYRELVSDSHFPELDEVLVRTYEELYFVNEYMKGISVVSDHNLYTYNDYANAALLMDNVAVTTIPLELNRQEIRKRNNDFSEMILYGYYPLMTTAGCVHKNSCGCNHMQDLHFLLDRMGAEFPVKNYCDTCFNVIYNSLPTNLLPYKEELKSFGIPRFRLMFTLETAKEVQAVLDEFENGIREKGNYTNGHYKRGVE